MELKITNYQSQEIRWPQSGKVIMAQYDSKSVVVYQSYRPEIGLFAIENQYFGGAFSYSRMSWVKPNFLWMMYRNGWGTKPGQEITLAITLKRDYFENILCHAIASSFNSSRYSNQVEWKKAVESSNVRLQWDPDHDPYGHKLDRRAIQLGLRNDFLEPFKGNGILKIENISEFVNEQRAHVTNDELNKLMTPEESVYQPLNEEIYEVLGLSVN